MPKAQSLRAADRLLAGYRPLRGVPDELVDPTGRMRPVWAGLLDHLSARDPQTLAADFARGAQYLRDAGVFFRHYGDSSQAGRDWPLSPLPILLAEPEWAGIARGLIQRADLLETVLADLYGPNQLAADGLLPASLIAQSREWLRPLVGVRPRSGHYLHFIAFELGRGPDGRWWVLGDRTEAPSGAGFALENRVASTRTFPELYPASNVHRLAGFFRAFRDALEGLRGPGGGRVGIFTPGAMTDTYYEQAYIARYLGLPLLEGGDMVVQNDALLIRTVDGLTPVDVLWRRMDAQWADPLELIEASRIGTPGLVSALRAGSVTMVNALGAGILETQALMAFLPAIARSLTGAPLLLPNIATWWCGGETQRAHVQANAHRMVIGPALATRMPFETDGPYAVGGILRGGTPNGATGSLADWITANSAALVGQELVTLSTTPAWQDGGLVPRPMTLRMFLARTAQGWQVMPGGFARVGQSTDATAIAMQSGSAVADLWIMSDTKVDDRSLLPAPQPAAPRAEPGALPSRAADNLFWLGRYIERTEGIVRLTRAYNARLADMSDTAPLLTRLADLLAQYGADAAEPLPKGLRQTLAAAVTSAGQIRDRFSVDGWAALKDLEKTLGRMAQTVQPGTDAAMAMGVLLRKITGFSGLVHENMYRAAGWRFLTIGRSLERAAMTAQMLSVFTDPLSPDGSLDLAIELGDSAMTHRQRYTVTTARASVVDLLAADANNPRSVLFHLMEIRSQAQALSGTSQPGNTPPVTTQPASPSDFEQQVRAVLSALAVRPPAATDCAALRKTHADILGLSTALSHQYRL